ncbi:phospholipid carrier-dependent glycosyltransferase [Virgisporangium ochraceum]|uniref:Polyprenol-phosphate-mannose--protein mannosyltransferase n=1 Tax=Virgisporangium ochraceum TaxID=65505 RepID=A0A8J4A0W8_9ACTN|nr:phospholipid carrier-dependent glycosyltransferase [Virgisporangium ochraceum]GIJ70866.1 phospholipid carrier-dependent glycosyltransferase [Virgisporangium ochraceum]
MTVEVPQTVRGRLATVGREPMSWLPTLFVVLLGAVLRLANLGHPNRKIFDEVYYATEAHELLTYGIEWRPENNAGDYVVHPPLGKWCIAVGEWAFGYNTFGWRISSVVAGVVSILLLVRIGRRLFRSTVLGCAAGLLLALDGLHFVLSRSALLDIFLMLFVLAAFGCVVLDRDQRRRRALDSYGALRLGFPWWRIGVAFFLGCACSVKLSGAFFIPAIILIMLIWEVGMRRAVGGTRMGGLRNVTVWTAAMGVLVLAVYLASWTGWFATDRGWNRHGLAIAGKDEPFLVGALRNLVDYHIAVYTYHTGLGDPHAYQSWPWQWLLMGRPVLFEWVENTGCDADRCVTTVLLLGNPVLWWSFVPALAALVWFGIAQRDKRAGVLGLMVAAGLLPWFWYHYDGGRTMYVFYALPALPYLILAVLYVLGSILRPPDRRMVGAVALGAYVLLVAACFAYLHPIYVGESIPYDAWWDRLFLGRRWV